MPKIDWKSVIFALVFILFTYLGIYLVSGHTVSTYIRWGYPPLAQLVAGMLLVSAAVLLLFRRTRWVGAVSGYCVMLPAAVTCIFNGDYGDAIEAFVVVGLIVWLVLDRPTKAGRRLWG